MPRIRSIKPDVLSDEELWDAGVETGFPIYQTWTGLWMYSDREGRFEWRPRKLKAGILPYWDGDFSRVLDALTTRDFVVRYEVDGREYGWVRTFKRHQVINNREAESILPPPPEITMNSDGSTRGSRVAHASGTGYVHALAEGKGKERKGRETRVADASDPLDQFASAWRRITHRSDFADGCGQYTGTELRVLKNFQKACDGSVAEFEARVTAQLAADSKGFLLKQTLLHWVNGPIQQRADSVPSTGPLPAQTIDDFDAEATLD